MIMGSQYGIDALADLLLTGFEERPVWSSFLCALSLRIGAGPAGFIFPSDNASFEDAAISIADHEDLPIYKDLLSSDLLKTLCFDTPKLLDVAGSKNTTRWCVLRIERSPQSSAWLTAPVTERLIPDWDEVLASLIPLLRRVIRLQDMMGDCERRLRVSEHVLETSNIGVVMVDAKARVFMMNESARSALEQSSIIQVRQGVLQAVRARDNEHLSQLIREMAGRQSSTADNSCYGSVAIMRDDQSLPLTLIVRPGPPHAPMNAPFRRSATVIIRDPARRIPLAPRDLEQLFALTKAEARLASLLSEGFSVEDAAAVMRISRNTVRAQLQKIFSKTDTNRQAELTRVLLSSVAPLTGNLAENR